MGGFSAFDRISMKGTLLGIAGGLEVPRYDVVRVGGIRTEGGSAMALGKSAGANQHPRMLLN